MASIDTPVPTTSPPSTAASPHIYLELDGLRGLAALCVVSLHLRFFALGGDQGGLIDRHQYLAVDFFLLLSGFVIAHAYEARLAQPGARPGFIRDRIIRLYPLLVLGAVIGALAALLSPAWSAVSAPRLAVYTVAGALALPLPGMDSAFPVNFPTWSLFWEVVLNLAFAWASPYLTTRRLLAGAGLCLLAMVAIAALRHNIDVGGRTKQLPLAGPRMAFSFMLGIVLLRLHRGGWLSHGGIRWWIAPLLAAALFALPAGGTLSLLYDLIMIALGFPLLLLAAAGSKPLSPRLSRFSGGLSYPLYILHVPLAGLLTPWLLHRGLTPGWALYGLEIALIAALSYATLLAYDEPLRVRLRQAYGSKRHR